MGVGVGVISVWYVETGMGWGEYEGQGSAPTCVPGITFLPTLPVYTLLKPI
jgi:hypothetical protein